MIFPFGACGRGVDHGSLLVEKGYLPYIGRLQAVKVGLDCNHYLVSVKSLLGGNIGEPPEVLGTGTEVPLKWSGDLLGVQKLILVKLEEDLFLACLMEVKNEEKDDQQS
jgi:hypothetical protein